MKKQSHLKKRVSESGGLKNKVTYRNYAIECDRARELDSILSLAENMDPQRYENLLKEFQSLCRVTREEVYYNLVVQTGRNAVAGILAGETTYTGAINYGALGTDATAVNTADTVLGTEVARKLFARRVRTTSAVNFDFYYSQADTDGTYEEFGLFIDGTSAADTGVLFNHVLTGGWTKTNTEAMTVSVQVNVNAS